MPYRLRWLLATSLLIALAGCDADEGADAPDTRASIDVGPPDATPPTDARPAADAAPDGAPYDGPTWHGAVRAIFETRCVQCHRAGGVAPFDLRHRDADWQAGAPPWVAPAVAALESRRMPPWPPAEDCRPLRHARVVPDAEREAVRRWAAAGYPAGDPAHYVAPPVPEAPTDERPPDLVLTAADGYVADTGAPDDYRCLPLQYTFERDTWVTRTRAVPDRTDIVHHIVTFLMPPETTERVATLDGQTETPGYRCFGDPVIYPTSVFSLWAPGANDDPLPDGGAILVPAGATLVMQVHYNLANGGGDESPDHSRLELWTLPEGELPEARIDVVGFADVWLDIPAGAAEHEGGHDFRFAGGGELVAVAPHMHLLGQRIRADLVRADGSETCLVDIPRWDFQWQAGYFYTDDAVPTVEAGDTLRLRCTYDNSAAGQPTDREPQPVGWGEGTHDEMCLIFGYVRRPVEQPYQACDGASACIRACPGDDSTCIYGCLSAGGLDCMICGANEWHACAFRRGCNAEVARMVGCINSTPSCGGGACVVADCLEESDAVLACSHALLLEGRCDGRLAQCGLQLGPPDP